MHNLSLDQFFTVGGGGGGGQGVCVCVFLNTTLKQTWREHDGLTCAFCTAVYTQPGPELTKHLTVQPARCEMLQLAQVLLSRVMFACLSICWILTYYVNEVDRCCRVQVPVQLV